MARHSHWARIKHKKEAADIRKGKEFSKIAKLIVVAARTGGGDLKDNPRLQTLLEKARTANMPQENIQRAIKRGTGEIEGAIPEAVVYEGYGPGGAAVIVEGLTDNRNRTASEVRLMFEHHGGNLGASGCVAWNFDTRGILQVEGPGVTEEKVMEAALDAGAQDVEPSGDGFQVLTDPKELEPVRAALKKASLPVASAEVGRVPKSTVEVDAAVGRRLLALLEALQEHDDVQNVASNFEAPDEIFQEASG